MRFGIPSHTMASLFKQPKSPYWWVKHKDKFGKWNRRSTKLRHDSARQTIEAEKIRAKYSLEEAESAGRKIDYSGAFSAWVVDWIAKSDIAKSTAKDRFVAWKAISDALSSQGVDHPCEVTYRVASDVYQILISRGYSDLTIHGRMVIFRMIMDEAVRMGFCHANPARMVRVKGGKPLNKKAELSHEDQARIEEFIQSGEAKEWFEVVFFFGLYHGMRLSECRLAAANFDLVNGHVNFIAKGSVKRQAPIHPKCMPIAERIVSGPPVYYPGTASMSNLFSRYAKSLGIQISHHCLRVTCITRLHRAGVPHVQIMKYVGHKTISSHLMYERLDVSDLVCVGRKLS